VFLKAIDQTTKANAPAGDEILESLLARQIERVGALAPAAVPPLCNPWIE
jgi:hypothetical protein